MTSPSHCSYDRLRKILRGIVDDAECSNVAEHVDNCANCRQRLDELAANERDWREARDMLKVTADIEQTELERVPRGRWSADPWQRRPTAWSESMARTLLAPPSHPEMLGRIGRYEVERLIGAGGMGVVFKAYDTELNRPVAVKLLAPYLAGSGAARQRFAREARAAAAIVHEHVVAIHNVESEGESPFLVMQFVGGESLQSRLDRVGSFDVCEILRISMQVASGLAAAHAQGLVHRDVKPSNILLEQGVERSLLTDFGLARAVDDASLTHTGHHPGTPQYMSPEQARGDAVDARSDLFSLGSVMYAMCTGRAPFRAESSYGILRRITDTEPRPIREINSQIPEWLERVISRLHSKSPDRRIQSAGELRDLLEQCLAHVQQPTKVPLPSSILLIPQPFALFQNPWRRIPGDRLARWTTLTLSVVLLVGVVAFIPAWQRSQSGGREGNTTLQSTKSESFPTQTVSNAASFATEWDATAQEVSKWSLDVQSLEERSATLWDQKPSVP